jgi:hypothetical protein
MVLPSFLPLFGSRDVTRSLAASRSQRGPHRRHVGRRLVGHLERDQLGQLAEVAGRERTPATVTARLRPGRRVPSRDPGD